MPDILLATDFSAAAATAARVARDYARRLGARLHVLNVVWPGTDPVVSSALASLAAELGGPDQVVTAVAAGLPAAEIVRYAEQHGIELIVIGTHGRTGLSRALLGSVAERVVRTAPCPVLTVPATWQRPEAPAAAPGPPELARCVVCAAPSEDLICAPCRARIRGEAVERKQREERAGRD